MSKKDICILEQPLHKNYISYDISEDMLSKLIISFDGSIIGFEKNILDGLNEKDIILQKMGYKDDEVPKSISSDDDLKKILLYYKE